MEKETVEEAEARQEKESDPEEVTGLVFGGRKWLQ
jgi:hypothetical protein